MAQGIFTFNNLTSSNFGIRLLQELEFSAPERDFDVYEIPGRNGELLIDNMRYKTKTQTFKAMIHIQDPENATMQYQITEIVNWLKAPVGFQWFEWDGEPDFAYKVEIQGVDTSLTRNPSFANLTITMKVHPIKFYKSELNVKKSVTSIENIGSVPAHPTIELLGSGGGTFKFGDSELRLTNVQSPGIIIDTQNQRVLTYDKKQPAYNNVLSTSLPVLKVGNNTITKPSGWTVNIASNSGVLA